MTAQRLALACTLFVASLATGIPLAASAAPVPDAVVDGTVFLKASSPDVPNGNIFLNFPQTTGSTSGTVATAASSASGQLQMTGLPVPLVSATATVTTTTEGSGLAQVFGFEKYFFRVDGPTATTLGRVDATGHVGINSLSALGQASAYGLFRLGEANGGPVLIDELLTVGGSDGTYSSFESPNSNGNKQVVDFVIGGDYLFKTNTVYEVILQSRLNVIAFGGGTTDLFASIDPTFQFDGPYSIEFSRGFGGGIVGGGGGTVPEPAIWALMLIGFGAVGSRLRRSRSALQTRSGIRQSMT